MASPLKFAAAAGGLSAWLLYMAVVYTIRIRHTSGKTAESRADIVESERVRRQSLGGAVLFGAVAMGFLILAVVR